MTITLGAITLSSRLSAVTISGLSELLHTLFPYELTALYHLPVGDYFQICRPGNHYLPLHLFQLLASCKELVGTPMEAPHDDAKQVTTEKVKFSYDIGINGRGD